MLKTFIQTKISSVDFGNNGAGGYNTKLVFLCEGRRQFKSIFGSIFIIIFPFFLCGEGSQQNPYQSFFFEWAPSKKHSSMSSRKITESFKVIGFILFHFFLQLIVIFHFLFFWIRYIVLGKILLVKICFNNFEIFVLPWPQHENPGWTNFLLGIFIFLVHHRIKELLILHTFVWKVLKLQDVFPSDKNESKYRVFSFPNYPTFSS